MWKPAASVSRLSGIRSRRILMERKKRVRRKKVLQGRIQKRRIQKRSLPLKRGIKNKFLFPQNGNESVKNGRLTQCEKRRFLHYLSKHSLDGRMLVSTRDDAINKAVVCFVRIWKEQELTASKPSGRAIFRFLTQDCGLKTEITIESYANKMNEWLKEKQQDVLTMAEVKRCFAGI